MFQSTPRPKCNGLMGAAVGISIPHGMFLFSHQHCFRLRGHNWSQVLNTSGVRIAQLTGAGLQVRDRNSGTGDWARGIRWQGTGSRVGAGGRDGVVRAPAFMAKGAICRPPVLSTASIRI